MRRVLLILALLTSPAFASLQTCTGIFAISTAAAGNTQSVSFTGGCPSFTPSILFFTSTGQTSGSTAITQALDLQQMFGMETSTSNRVCIASSAIHGTTPAATANMNRVDGPICSVTTAGALEGVADVTALSAGGFTITIGTQFPTAYQIVYMAIGGADIAQAQITAYTKTLAGAGGQAYTLPFSQPSALIFVGASPGLTSAPSTVTSSVFSFGVWDTNQQWYNANACTTGSAATSCKNTQGLGAAAFFPAASNSVTPGSMGRVKSVVGTTLNMDWRGNSNSPAASPFYVLEIQGGKWQALTVPISHTAAQVTTLQGGFTPSGAMLWTGGNSSYPQPTYTGTWEPVWGFIDQANNTFAMGAKNIDANNPTKDSLSLCIACLMYRGSGAGAIEIQYDTASLTSDGFTGTTTTSGSANDSWSFALLMGSNTGGSNTSGPTNSSGPGAKQ